MPLDLSSLDKATASLKDALEVAERLMTDPAVGQKTRSVIRAGVIQNFEFTFELCWKFMQRRLSHDLGDAQVGGISRRELFRIAAGHSLINDVDRWFDYHEARNETAHTYDPDKAQDVFGEAKRFYADAVALLVTLKRRND